MLDDLTVADLQQMLAVLDCTRYGDGSETYTTGYRNGHRNGRAEVHYMPAADVAPVRHGRWEMVPYNGVYDMRCSVCGFCPGIRFYSSNYCPECGAKMGEE